MHCGIVGDHKDAWLARGLKYRHTDHEKYDPTIVLTKYCGAVVDCTNVW